MKDQFIKKANELVQNGDQFIKQYGSNQFHLGAQDLLSQQKIHKFFDLKNLMNFAVSSKELPPQNFKHLEFSDFPLTIARGKDCFIDIYFWRRRPTVIHNHHFRGAFQCLLGQNVDSEFKFKQTSKLTKFHSIGNLEKKRETKIGIGHIKAINFQDKFIHQNLHQADLTVNLCFRTPDVAKKNLSNFLYSGLKFEKNQNSLQRVERIIALTQMGEFDFNRNEFSLEDAFNFLLITHGLQISGPSIMKLKKILEAKVKKETGLNMPLLLRQHEQEIDRLEELYE